jgi:hypothetical protein
VTWIRRTRGFIDQFADNTPALYENLDYYQIRVWDAVDATTPKRTIGTEGRNWSYAIGVQQDDGLAEAEFWVNVRQRSRKVGWGQASPRIRVPWPREAFDRG